MDDTTESLTNEEAEKQPDAALLMEELADIKELNDLYAGKIKQQAADFENYRNRTAKEMSQIYDKGARDVILALLPIVDNFALATKDADKTDGFAAGMFMIQQQLHNALKNLGVEKIPAVGEKFDIRYHSAVSHIVDEGVDEGIITQELQGGYMYKDNVIRHAMVVVAN